MCQPSQQQQQQQQQVFVIMPSSARDFQDKIGFDFDYNFDPVFEDYDDNEDDEVDTFYGAVICKNRRSSSCSQSSMSSISNASTYLSDFDSVSESSDDDDSDFDDDDFEDDESTLASVDENDGHEPSIVKGLDETALLPEQKGTSTTRTRSSQDAASHELQDIIDTHNENELTQAALLESVLQQDNNKTLKKLRITKKNHDKKKKSIFSFFLGPKKCIYDEEDLNDLNHLHEAWYQATR